MPIPGEGAITRTKRNCRLIIKDGTVHSHEVRFTPGNLVLNVPGEAIILSLERGAIGDPPDLAPGDEQPCSGSFSGRMASASKADVATLRDILFRTGYVGTTWVTTHPRADVFTLTLEWHIEASVFGEEDEIVRLKYVRFSGTVNEGDVVELNAAFESFMCYPEVELAA